MNGADENKERNREIARNEEKRQAIGAIRVSGWAIVFTIIVVVIVAGLLWFVRH
jgi:CHASE3 domain sensor protein